MDAVICSTVAFDPDAAGLPVDLPVLLEAVPLGDAAVGSADAIALGCESPELDFDPHPVITRADRPMAAVAAIAFVMVFVMHQ